MYSAALSVLRKEGPASLIHGVIELRRAWKMYTDLQRKLFNVYKKLEPTAKDQYGVDPNDLPQVNDTDEARPSADRKSDNVDHKTDDLSLEMAKNLLAAVSYGFGITQLCFSFLPHRFLIILNLLGGYIRLVVNFSEAYKTFTIFPGFEVDRKAALSALHFCSLSQDLRAPFADIVLLAYSIIGPQVFGYSEVEMYLNKKEIDFLLHKNLTRNPKSCFFLFLKAKSDELILRNSVSALEYLELLKNCAGPLQEMKSMAFYEMGFLHLMSLDYDKALGCFEEFGKYSNWSQSLNTYLVVLIGNCKELWPRAKLESHLKKVLSSTNRRNFLEKFARRRLDFLYNETNISKDICEILVVEILYLFLYLPYCSQRNLEKIYESNLL